MNYFLKKNLFVVTIIAINLLSTKQAHGQQKAYLADEFITSQYTNPVFEPVLADPTVVRADDGWFYASGTEDYWGAEFGVKILPIVRSKDLTTWTYVNDAFLPSGRPNWKPSGGLWAPDITKIGDIYAIFYSFSTWGDTNPGIGVATAPNPTGPYTDRGKILDSQSIGVPNTIDPFYWEENGEKYLFFGSYSTATTQGTWGFLLDETGLKPKNADFRDKFKIAAGDFEAVTIFKRDGYYYFIGSKGGCCAGANSTYNLRVGRSTSLKGPYLDKNGNDIRNRGYGTQILRPNTTWAGTGHSARIITDDAGDDWILYHAILKTEPYIEDSQTNKRMLMLDKVTWSADGWPVIENTAPSSTQRTGPTWKKQSFSTHGSIAKQNQTLYQVVYDNALLTNPRQGISHDFKVVTYNNKTWGWGRVQNGTLTQNNANPWYSHFRYYDASNKKTENNLLKRWQNTAFGSTDISVPENAKISFFHQVNNVGFSMTDNYPYNPAIQNSKDPLDVTAPAWDRQPTANYVVNNWGLLDLSVSEDSDNCFFHITDDSSFEEIYFTDKPVLEQLKGQKKYKLRITPVDFSGNIGEERTLEFTTPAGSIVNGTTLTKWDSTDYPDDPELVVSISSTDKTLTIGCTTVSDEIYHTGWNSRIFYNPSVEIDGVRYPMQLDENKNTASISFSNTIGGKTITPGMILRIRWHVYWDNTTNLHYFTGNYLYEMPFGSTDVKSYSQNTANFYPNPAFDYITFDSEMEQCEVFDINGELLIKTNLSDKVNIKNLEKGIYFIKTKDKNNQILISKLIKK